MKRFEIDAKFTELVGLYLQDGWVINSNSMAGHQGEEGKIDLVKNNELIRIYMITEMSKNWLDDNGYHGEILYLRVGRWNYPANDSINRTVWMKDFYIFQEECFYEIRHKEWYVETLDEAMKIQKLHYSRYGKHSVSYTEELKDKKYLEIATKYLKRKVGYKRVSWDHIKVTKNYSINRNHMTYYIEYNGNHYRLA